jgi:glycyl-tRNA synthetase beta chain
MLGVIATVLKSKLRFPFTKIARTIYDLPDGSLAWFLDFLDERLKVQQKEAGVRHDLIDAVFALGGEDDLVRLLARVHALQAFVQTDDGKNLLAGYKRAANILKAEEKKGWDVDVTNPAPEPAEAALIARWPMRRPRPKRRWRPRTLPVRWRLWPLCGQRLMISLTTSP